LKRRSNAGTSTSTGTGTHQVGTVHVLSHP
jgi:hypothetical protein